MAAILLKEPGRSRFPKSTPSRDRQTDRQTHIIIQSPTRDCATEASSEIVKGIYRKFSANHGKPVFKKDGKVKGLDVAASACRRLPSLQRPRPKSGSGAR